MNPDARPPVCWPLVGAETMRALDRYTIETLGVPGEVLMESAGRAAAEVVLGLLPSGGEVRVVCGMGNNGGDGFVVARHLAQAGVPVRAALLGEPRGLRGDAAANFRRARALGVPLDGPRWRAPRRGVVVDAIFGTGLSRTIDRQPAASIRRMAACRSAEVRCVALDVPSGVCSETGQVLGGAAQMDATVTFGLPKLGLALEPGRGLAGRVVVARIGIVDAVDGAAPDAELWSRAAAGARLPERPAQGHKGSFGHVLLAAGSEGKSGAAALAAAGAARGGAGLVTLACPAGLNDILEVKCTEAMTVPLPDTSERALSANAVEPLLALAHERAVVGLGPGLGRAAETVKLVRGVVPRIDRPLALDADGLFAFAGEPEALRDRGGPTVLTPHPGEAALLLGGDARAVNADRVGAARRLADRSGATVLLKGASSVIATPEGRVVVNPTGGPALGSGGTGDVLLGLLAALLAQGVEAGDAAALAAFWHGAAGDALTARQGPSGLLAGELAEALPAAAEPLRAAAATPPRGNSLALAFPEP